MTDDDDPQGANETQHQQDQSPLVAIVYMSAGTTLAIGGVLALLPNSERVVAPIMIFGGLLWAGGGLFLLKVNRRRK